MNLIASRDVTLSGGRSVNRVILTIMTIAVLVIFLDAKWLFPLLPSAGVSPLVFARAAALTADDGVSRPRSLFAAHAAIIDLASDQLVADVHPRAASCPWVILAYHAECGHCRASAPHFVDLANDGAALARQLDRAREQDPTVTADDSPVLFGAINCGDFWKGCDAMTVNAVPRYHLYLPRHRGARRVVPAGETVPPFTGRGLRTVGTLAAAAEGGGQANSSSTAQEAVMLVYPLASGDAQSLREHVTQMWWGGMPPWWRPEDTERCAALRTYLQRVRQQEIQDVSAGQNAAEDEKRRGATGGPPPDLFDPRDAANAFYYSMTSEVPPALLRAKNAAADGGALLARTQAALVRFLEAVAAALPGLGAAELLPAARGAAPLTEEVWAEVLAGPAGDRIPRFLQPDSGGDGGGRGDTTTTKKKKGAQQLQWFQCRGSGPHMRGFPCGMWVLYHALTVNYRPLRAEGEAAPGPATGAPPRWKRTNTDPAVLHIIKDYVRYFFSCTPCREHFITGFHPQEAGGADGQQQQEQQQQQPDDVAVQLWRMHNTVNERLAGAPGEDPAVPKVPFPSPQRCAACYATTSAAAVDGGGGGSESPAGREKAASVSQQQQQPRRAFAEAQVARFLRRHYRWLGPAAPAMVRAAPEGSSGYATLAVAVVAVPSLALAALGGFLAVRRSWRRARMKRLA